MRFAWSNDRPSLRLWNDKVRIDLRGRLRADVNSSGTQVDGPDAFDLRRRRVGISGSIADVLDFQLERELWSDKGWRDAFANLRFTSAAQVKVGQFKLPFSMDELTSASNLDFVFRSLAASALAPARDVGVMLHGRTAVPGAGSRLWYDVGLFRHDGDNASLGPLTRLSPAAADSVARRTVAARLQVSPFDRSKKEPKPKTAGAKAGKTKTERSSEDRGSEEPPSATKKAQGVWQSLRLGIAATVNQVPEGDNGLRGQDALGTTFFPRIDVSGRRVRVGAEASWRRGPATIRSEFMQVRDQRLGQGLANENLPDVVATGWYLQGTWGLIRGGKNASRAGRWIGRGGVGDVELATRLERLQFASAATGGEEPSASPRAANLAAIRDTVFTAGVNWRPVPVTRVQLNVIRDAIQGVPWTGRERPDRTWSVVSSFQLAF